MPDQTSNPTLTGSIATKSTRPNEDFIQKLQNSLSCIENLLFTSINFEGTPPTLLIDELQFLLNAGCVIIDCPPDVAYANILQDEKAALMSCAETYAWVEVSSGSASGFLTVRWKEFPALVSGSPTNEPLQLALNKVSSAYEYTLRNNGGDAKDWTLTIYFEPAAVLTPFWDVPEFRKFIEEALRLVLTKFDPASRLRIAGTETLYRCFYNSSYLTYVLETLQQRIDKHLRQQNNRFAAPNSPGFFIQFFLVTDSGAGDGHRHRLRYFPMPDERPALQDPRTIGQIKDALRKAQLPVPEDITKFITEDYFWTAENAFVGYCCDTAASLYLEDWQNEPRAQGAHLDSDQVEQRRMATLIFQSLRRNTPHQFLLPLFANMRPIGVVVINCPEKIDVQSRLVPIRSARDLGYVVTMALKTDDLVNHLQEKKLQAAEVSSYKYITHSMLHTEGAYCMEIDRFLEEIKREEIVRNYPQLSPFVRRLTFIVTEKKSLIDEFRSIEDPVRNVLTKHLYPIERGLTADDSAISVDELSKLLVILNDIFSQNALRKH